MDKGRPVAVVGMSGIFPKALDLDTFWQNILNKVDAAEQVPKERWIVDPELMCHKDPVPDKAFSKRACLINGFRLDPAGLNLDTKLLEKLDPLYHMVLHAGRDALLQVNPSSRNGSLNRERIGVVLSAIALPTDTSSCITRKILKGSFENKLFGGQSDIKNTRLSKNECIGARVTSLPAAILAEALDLGGGTYTLDAACASSLFAVRLASDRLNLYQADLMLAGGVARPESLYTQVGFSQLMALSPSGRCAPFDESADGLVVGEGVGILALKRLEDAQKDGDKILAVICGIGLSNDLGGTLLAPDAKGQVRSMEKAYRSAGWKPSDVDLIECHGAGTPVGDNTELVSLKTLWGKTGWDYRQCPIGSVKSMIGHLLTAAGAAGMIKTIMALNHKVLPPTCNFSKPPQNSPLIDSPFNVQTEPETWHARDKNTPRRAAVSAFGFGGINAHLLLEEWKPEKERSISVSFQHAAGNRKEPVAIVGMEAVFGSTKSLKEFQTTIFKGDSIFEKLPPKRWKGTEDIAGELIDNWSFFGGFLESLSIEIGKFRIPPAQIPDILIQHLLMLKAAAEAMKDAGLKLTERRENMGAVIGMNFDFEATDFHFRWNLINEVIKWKKRIGIDDNEAEKWLKSLQESYCPPLTSTRTLGALGGIIASRIAKEFNFGGPSFVVSSDEGSGIKALEIGARFLQQGETDIVLAGAVDLSCDIRSIMTFNNIRPYAKGDMIFPFDKRADGSLPGEGAAAVVLKRLDCAVKDNDRIYAVIKGFGSASGGRSGSMIHQKERYKLSLKRAFDEAGIPPDFVTYFEAHGSGDPNEDNVETDALCDFFKKKKRACAIGSVKASIGHTHAASGLASLVKTSLCLFNEIIPPLKNFQNPKNPALKETAFYIPKFSHYWVRNRKEGTRSACVGSMTTNGCFSHVILEAFEDSSYRNIPQRVKTDRRRPLGSEPYGLFVLEGSSKDELIHMLDSLGDYINKEVCENQHIEYAARRWYLKNRIYPDKKYRAAIVADKITDIKESINKAKEAVLSDTPIKMKSKGGVFYTPNLLGNDGEIAFVFPGAGNHYLGMGRGLGVIWPEIYHEMDKNTMHLKTQMIPECYIPFRASWDFGWEDEAYKKIVADPLNMIFGQVVHGGAVSSLVREFKIEPSAVIGYSLGESAGLFAMGAWPDRGEMLKRMQSTNLFSTELAGDCNAARKAWKIPSGEDVHWRAAVVNMHSEAVQKVLDKHRTSRLLIINTENQCVIGGIRQDIESVIKELGCEAVYLDGVVTVHCDAAKPVADDYRKLHLFPVRPVKGIRFYSCALGRSYPVTTDSAADSILKQAVSGFDFSKTINRAYLDGVKIFLEMGPNASCTRMISQILGNKPHLAVSACVRGEDDYLTIIKLLAELFVHHVYADLDYLYQTDNLRLPSIEKRQSENCITIFTGGRIINPLLYKTEEKGDVFLEDNLSIKPFFGLQDNMINTINATSYAHERFLQFSADNTQAIGDLFSFQTELLQRLIEDGGKTNAPYVFSNESVAFSRDMCMEFATGSVARVFGPEFAVVDTYKARVRLPDEPLMLVDRIISIEGEKGSLGRGRIITEHDVLPDAWYLDGGRAPVCISVEAGQADLFLSSYLGIDFKVKGERTYRLLDAAVEFHRGLPQPGDVIRYEITIEKFIRRGRTYFFFFNFKGFIGSTPLISMTDGCAGFFTNEEVENSGGIVFTETEAKSFEVTGKSSVQEFSFVPVSKEKYTSDLIDELRKGNLSKCFGSSFDGINLSKSLRLPGGRMKLIDRILSLDPKGGRWGLGKIRAEADIHPDDWFLTCHFVDDMVMPGTLMYEYCAHTLRVFLQRIGWISEKPGVCYEPVFGVKSVLKCRGPVTPKTRHVIYEVEVKKIVLNPEPYVIANAFMYADGRRIVWFKDMSMKMTGITGNELEDFWKNRSKNKKAIFDRSSFIEFARGKPSYALGEKYKPFDDKRFIARLPSPPYLMIDRITKIEPKQWVLEPDGWIEAQYDVPESAWYFKANFSKVMPFCILVEIALQPCGWLAAYMGSALKSSKDLRFRNLDGKAVLHRNLYCDSKTLTIRSRLTQASVAGDMIIEQFDFEVLDQQGIAYEGETAFGFFSEEALANQVGIQDADKEAYVPTSEELKRSMHFKLEDLPPFFPDDINSDYKPQDRTFLSMPAKALKMIDTIDVYIPDGGPFGIGFIRGKKYVLPDEWFFKAHFYQDPVIPGSLGIESFLQLLKFIAIDRFEKLKDLCRFELLTEKPHIWTYRGQITPKNRIVEVEAVVTHIEDAPFPIIQADGYIKMDGLYIYKVKDFGIKLCHE